MIRINKIILAITLISSCMYGMNQQVGLSQQNQKNLVTALNSYKLSNYFAARTPQEIETIIKLAHVALHDPNTLVMISDNVKNVPSETKQNRGWTKTVLNDLIKKAEKKLQEIKSKKPIIIAKPIAQEKKEVLSNQKKRLYNFVEAFIKGDTNYINTRKKTTYQSVADLSAYALKNPAEINQLHNHFKLDKEQIKQILQNVKQIAAEEFKHAGNKENKTASKIAANSNIHKQPLPIPAPIITREQSEEEILANRLYIGLDVKDYNTDNQPIHWQEPINAITSKINDAQFLPNDYFHITIAWYETKNPISPEVIAQVEHALAKASQILKIVFPIGVNVSLLDGAILLGFKKGSVALRVAESADLKKLQEILLKFLSFEKIEGFKFNTFEKDFPLHVTLGKILPSKGASKYQSIAESVNAPEGIRASKSQSSTINTFRLTYSGGQAWQEKMSYKF